MRIVKKTPDVPAEKTGTRQSLHSGQKVNICQKLNQNSGAEILTTGSINTANSCASDSCGIDDKFTVILQNSQTIPNVPAENNPTRRSGQKVKNIRQTLNQKRRGGDKLTTESTNAANSCVNDSGGIDDKFKIVSNLPAETPIDLTLIKSLIANKRSNQSYSCKDCGQICKSSRNLVIHRRIHTGERPYPCSQCNLTFRQSHHRKIHMRAKHGITLESSQVTKQEIVVVTKEGIRYKCHYCSKMLMSRSGRRKHERWHLGLRPHKCDNCGESFKQSQHLQKHKLSRRCNPDRAKTGARKKSKDSSGREVQEYYGSGPSDGVIAPVTPLHLVTKESTVGVTLEATNGNIHQGESNINSANASVPCENPQQSLDMPSALGLISTDLLKTKTSTTPLLAANTCFTSAQESSAVFTEESAFPLGAGEGALPIKDEPSNKGSENLEYFMKMEEESEGERSESGNLRADVENLFDRPEVGRSPCDMQMGVSPDQSDAEMLANTENAVPNYEPSALTVVNGNQSRASTIENDRELEPNSDRRHQCPECGQYYKTRQNLGIHMRIHTGERPHMCTLCSKTFIQPHHLKAHMKSQHAIFMVTPAKPVRQEEILMTPHGLRFKCQHCPKLLTSKNGRQKHERWHLGLRPHKCEVCGKSFKQSHHLKRHRAGAGCMPPMLQQMQNQTTQSIPAPVDNGTYTMILPSPVLVPGSSGLPANTVPGLVPNVPGLIVPQLASGVVGVVAATQPNQAVDLSQATPAGNSPQSCASSAAARAATSRCSVNLRKIKTNP